MECTGVTVGLQMTGSLMLVRAGVAQIGVYFYCSGKLNANSISSLRLGISGLVY